VWGWRTSEATSPVLPLPPGWGGVQREGCLALPLALSGIEVRRAHKAFRPALLSSRIATIVMVDRSPMPLRRASAAHWRVRGEGRGPWAGRRTPRLSAEQ
jgi:hypothetical protein